MILAALLLASGFSQGLLYQTVLDQVEARVGHSAMNKAFAGLADRMVTLEVTEDDKDDSSDE